MTAKHTTETAIKATKGGAYDYFAKPDVFDLDLSRSSWVWISELVNMIKQAAERGIESKRLAAKVKLPEDTTTTGSGKSDRMIGKTRAMLDVFKAIGRAATSDITVLIRGETGTGKELAARALYSRSARSAQPFIVVNCAAIPENLLESELFGHEKGAFTNAQARRIGRFEQADHGTIFLDEIGDMSLPLQQKLLRVLQEKTIERVGGKEIIPLDVRVIAATHRNLEWAIQENQFRQDLYFRLNVAVIYLPPLRERREDIPDLVHYFLRKHGAEFGSANPLITADAIQLLQQQEWPGNVRQLRNVVRKALIHARSYAISSNVIQEVFAQMSPPRPEVDQPFAGFVSELLARAKAGELENAQAALTETVDRELYTQAIRQANGDQSKAARWLGVSRPTMLEKLTRLGLHPAGN
jgi:DNA-binding NtrC family response regulator